MERRGATKTLNSKVGWAEPLIVSDWQNYVTMKTRTLTIEVPGIPEPGYSPHHEQYLCPPNCPANLHFAGCPAKLQITASFVSYIYVPGPGCPWYKEPNVEGNANE